MEKFLTYIEEKTVSVLTVRRNRRAAAKAARPRRTFWGEVKEWIRELGFAVCFILLLNQFIFQLFVIPSPSMVDTFLIGDRVYVSKMKYGIELYPGGPKILSTHRVPARDDVITFYNPEYESRGPVFDILAQALYLGSFSLINIDVDSNGNPRERLYVKRAAATGGDVVRFRQGNTEIRASGTYSFIPEKQFREDNQLSQAPRRTVEESVYPGLKAWAALYEYQERGFSLSQAPLHIRTAYQNSAAPQAASPQDFYEFSAERVRTATALDPADMQARSERTKADTGIYVPESYTLPLGDNRDNSHDGRYFGPVPNADINGGVIYRIWPLSRMAAMRGR